MEGHYLRTGYWREYLDLRWRERNRRRRLENYIIWSS
jgi:hypothetical protein